MVVWPNRGVTNLVTGIRGANAENAIRQKTTKRPDRLRKVLDRLT